MGERGLLASALPALLFWFFLLLLSFSGYQVSWVVWTAPFWAPAALAAALAVIVVLICVAVIVVVGCILLYAIKVSDDVERRHVRLGGVTKDTQDDAPESVPYENKIQQG